jgi:hypothetical protein
MCSGGSAASLEREQAQWWMAGDSARVRERERIKQSLGLCHQLALTVSACLALPVQLAEGVRGRTQLVPTAMCPQAPTHRYPHTLLAARKRSLTGAAPQPTRAAPQAQPRV